MDLERFSRAWSKSFNRPMEVDEEDLRAVEQFDPTLVAVVEDRRKAAQIKAVQLRQKSAPPPQPAASRAPLTMAHVEPLLDAIARAIAESINPVDARVKTLESRVLELEANAAVREKIGGAP
jgi:hypothetical protein